MLHCRGRRILVRAVNGKFLRLVGRGDLGRRRRTRGWIGLSLLAGPVAISIAALRTTRLSPDGFLCTLVAEANMLTPLASETGTAPYETAFRFSLAA